MATATLEAADNASEYNPAVVDSVLRENMTDTVLSELSAQTNAFSLPELPVMDVQSLRKRQALSSVYIVSAMTIFLIVLLKFLYNQFFQAGILSLTNEKIFLLHFRGNKFSDTSAVLLLYLIRMSVPALILQYGFYYYTGNKELIAFSYFLILFAIISLFSLVKLAAEYLVQLLIGQIKVFKPFLIQHLIITTWLWLPSLIILLIIFVNKIDITLYGYLMAVLAPVVLATLYSAIRALFIWGSMWRDNLLYFFTYLCTFKILPYLIAAKWLSDNWKILI